MTVAHGTHGRVVMATYTALGQVASVTADGQTTTFHTDPNGRFHAVSKAASTDAIHFDAAGRPDTPITNSC